MNHHQESRLTNPKDTVIVMITAVMSFAILCLMSNLF